MSSTPQLKSEWIASLCELGPVPLVATGLFRQWLTNHFSADSSGNRYLEDTSPSLIRSLWKPDKTTGISIESHLKWVPEMTEHNPAVLLKRNAWRRVRVGINDEMMGTYASDGSRSFANYWQGGHTLFCIAGEGAETEKLAAEVFRELNEFGPYVRMILSLMRFEVVEVGEVHTLQRGKDNFVVPITVAYAYEEAWTIKENGGNFQQIDLAMF